PDVQAAAPGASPPLARSGGVARTPGLAALVAPSGTRRSRWGCEADFCGRADRRGPGSRLWRSWAISGSVNLQDDYSASEPTLPTAYFHRTRGRGRLSGPEANVR